MYYLVIGNNLDYSLWYGLTYCLSHYQVQRISDCFCCFGWIDLRVLCCLCKFLLLESFFSTNVHILPNPEEFLLGNIRDGEEKSLAAGSNCLHEVWFSLEACYLEEAIRKFIFGRASSALALSSPEGFTVGWLFACSKIIWLVVRCLNSRLFFLDLCMYNSTVWFVLHFLRVCNWRCHVHTRDKWVLRCNGTLPYMFV